MIRLAFRIALMVLGLVVCVPLHFAWIAAGRRSPWPRRFLFWIGHAAGLRVRTCGLPLPAPVLFLCNHQSWLDIMALAGATGTAFVSKEEVARWPVAGWLSRLNNTVFIARSRKHGVQGQAHAVREALSRGQPLALFPEGTTGGGGTVLPFRASLLAALYPAVPGIRVQPVAIDYGSAMDDIAWVGDEPAPRNGRRVLSRPGTIPVRLLFLDPIDPGDCKDRKALATRAREEIVSALGASEAGDDPLYPPR